MAVPDFQSMMLPLLEAIADGAVHSNSAAYDSVAKRMTVAAEDLQLMHSGGEQTVFYNRVAWGNRVGQDVSQKGRSPTESKTRHDSDNRVRPTRAEGQTCEDRHSVFETN